MKRAAGSESTEESDSDAEGPAGDAAVAPKPYPSGGHARKHHGINVNTSYSRLGGGDRAGPAQGLLAPRPSGGYRRIQPMGPGFPYIDGHHIEADSMPAAHRDGVYGYGEPDPATPFYRPFQSAPTFAAYRHQFGVDPTGISSTNHELNARQRANAERSMGENQRSSRLNSDRVDYGTGHRDVPAGSDEAYNPGPWLPHTHMVNVGGDGHFRHSISDYVSDLDYHADTNDHMRDGRDDDHFPPVLAREEERTTPSEVNRLKRRRAYNRAKLEETRKAMQEHFAKLDAEGFFGRHFR